MVKMSERKERIKILIIFFLVIFLIMAGSVKINRQVGISYFNIHLQITNYTSAGQVNKDIFFYIEPGKSVNGNTIIKNEDKETRKVTVIAEGELADREWLKMSETSFKLEANETKTIGIEVEVPINAEGNFSGRLRIESR